MAYIEVDIDLDQFETGEIIDELLSRFKSYGKRQLNDEQKAKIKNELSDLWKTLKTSAPQIIPTVSLEDEMKLVVIKEAWNRYTSWQFEEKLK